MKNRKYLKLKSISIDPFILFSMLAVLIFIANQLRTDDRKTITVSHELRMQLNLNYQEQYGRQPSGKEMLQLIRQWTTDEALYRQALNLGLEQDDELIRRRLIQKMTLLIDANAPKEQPNEQQLKEWYGKNKNTYRLPDRYSISVIELSRRFYHGKGKEKGLLLREELNENNILEHDGKGLKQFDYKQLSAQEMTGRFGKTFTESLLLGVSVRDKGGAEEIWNGPANTPLGWVVFKVNERELGRQPVWHTLKSKLVADINRDKKQKYIASKMSKLLALYES